MAKHKDIKYLAKTKILKKWIKFKNLKNLTKYKKLIKTYIKLKIFEKFGFLNFNAKLTFTKLR